MCEKVIRPWESCPETELPPRLGGNVEGTVGFMVSHSCKVKSRRWRPQSLANKNGRWERACVGTGKMEDVPKAGAPAKSLRGGRATVWIVENLEYSPTCRQWREGDCD